ncbi:MAG: hypothetical protein R6U32_06015 [Candidatus Woesearchaeota archaeon]
MKLSNKLIDEVIAELVGEDAIPLVKALKNRKNVSEFKLAEKLGQEINVVRNMLYRLYHLNLVSFVRRKDRVKGWYIYYWTFKTKMIKYLAEQLRKKKLEKTKEKLEREKNSQFFNCPNKCMRLSFDQVVDFRFKCPECGAIMEQEDPKEIVEKLKKDIKKLEESIK